MRIIPIAVVSHSNRGPGICRDCGRGPHATRSRLDRTTADRDIDAMRRVGRNGLTTITPDRGVSGGRAR